MVTIHEKELSIFYTQVSMKDKNFKISHNIYFSIN